MSANDVRDVSAETSALPGPASGGVGTASAPAELLRLHVPDMDCPSCVARIRDRLSRCDGVVTVEGSPVRRELEIVYDGSRTEPETLRDEVGRLGYTPETREERAAGSERSDTWRGRQARIAYASAGLFALAGLLHLAGIAPRVLATPVRDLLLPDLVFVLSALVGGWNFFPKGWKAARALALDMNFLMTVAILGAVGIGEYAEGAAIAFLFAIAELLERYAVDRARASVEALVRLAPEVARVRRGGREVSVPVDDVRPGELVVLRPGDRVPTDGTVVEGASAVDQSSVTGESMPVEKTAGSTVFAGTINREGYLLVRTDRPASESTLARIIRMVEEAEAGSTRTERFVERFARWYTPTVTVAALLTVVLPVVLLGEPFGTWFIRGLTLLVIACPCALVISTPVAVVSGVTAAARHGVLIKGGVHLETLGSVRALALDKTGTLTFGHPVVVEDRIEPGEDAAELHAAIAALESRSEHPLARALLEHLDPAGGLARPAVEAFTSVPGRGVEGRVAGRTLRVGNPAFATPGAEMPAPFLGDGRTPVAVSVDGRPAAWFAVADRTRGYVAEAVARLREDGVEHVAMLTGDTPSAAGAIGREIGVDDVRAGLLPEQKVEVVRELRARHGPVAMVGDGVNDAPALATADVGIVMGAAGSDAALETADIALMGDDLTLLPYVRGLSREAVRVIRANIVLALLVKGVLAVGVPLGAVSLIAAVVIGDMGVSLAVTANALRLGRLRP